MRAGIKNAIIAILKDYPNYEAYRRERELDLRYPAIEPDDNVGGGRTTREHDAKMINYIVSIESDKRLRALERQHKAVQYALYEADNDTRTIIEELYFKERPLYSMAGLVMSGKLKNILSERSAYRARNEFIEQVADNLGIKYL